LFDWKPIPRSVASTPAPFLVDAGSATSKHARPATPKQNHLTAPADRANPQVELTVRAESQHACADLPLPSLGMITSPALPHGAGFFVGRSPYRIPENGYGESSVIAS
jgi:hypothetical protein